MPSRRRQSGREFGSADPDHDRPGRGAAGGGGPALVGPRALPPPAVGLDAGHLERARTGDRQGDCRPERSSGDPAWPQWLRRALSPYAVPARVEHAGNVDASTLELLACNATVRAALLAPNGALLDLGRAQRLATPAQKTALLARDGGCVIPGCTVPGDACDAHHVHWWQRGGPTDLENLALLCGRHHTEVHLEEWEIRMLDGIPWVVPPRWVDPARRLLRNAAHHPPRHRPAAA